MDRAQDYRRRQETVGEWPIAVTSYRIGDEYYCAVDNVSPGACLCRATAGTREEAEEQALRKAREMVARTRTLPT